MTKLQALRKAIHVLENDLVKYSWTNSSSCNCGVLAQQVMNCNSNELISKLYRNNKPIGDHWTGKVKHQVTCIQTGLPLNEVFKSLFKAGFSADEIEHLEHLSDPEILKKFDNKYELIISFRGIKLNLRRSEKNYLIQYLKAWVNILEPIKAEPKEQQNIKTEYRVVVVHVDEKVKELTKQNLILS